MIRAPPAPHANVGGSYGSTSVEKKKNGSLALGCCSKVKEATDSDGDISSFHFLVEFGANKSNPRFYRGRGADSSEDDSSDFEGCSSSGIGSIKCPRQSSRLDEFEGLQEPITCDLFEGVDVVPFSLLDSVDSSPRSMKVLPREVSQFEAVPHPPNAKRVTIAWDSDADSSPFDSDST